uniref:Fatty acid desaturase n=1 Tax=Cyanothece sp. (strain PCC 7425 / ATCC 29141) TaxID=395961 RepID=B8HKY9_CYAP4
MELNLDTAMPQDDLNFNDLADREIFKKTIHQIIKFIPKDCFVKNSWKTWKAVIENYLIIVLAYILLSFSPWYIYPPILLIIGTAFAGLFILAHDCGHRSFSDRGWVNDIAGQFFLLPLLYPFETWRIRHNCHHTYTNKLGGKSWKQFLDVRDRKADIAWFPVRQSLWNKLNFKQKFVFWLLRGPLWWIAFLYKWWVEFLCYDINIHIPHHLSVAIPHYNLRLADDFLKQNSSPYMKKRLNTHGNCSDRWEIYIFTMSRRIVIVRFHLMISSKGRWFKLFNLNQFKL